MCQECGCEPCIKCGAEVINGVCSGCGGKTDNCDCESAKEEEESD